MSHEMRTSLWISCIIHTECPSITIYECVVAACQPLWWWCDSDTCVCCVCLTSFERDVEERIRAMDGVVFTFQMWNKHTANQAVRTLWSQAKLISNNRSIWQQLGIFMVMWCETVRHSQSIYWPFRCRLIQCSVLRTVLANILFNSYSSFTFDVYCAMNAILYIFRFSARRKYNRSNKRYCYSDDGSVAIFFFIFQTQKSPSETELKWILNNSNWSVTVSEV